MKESLIEFETAKLAKEKGFNIPVLDFFRQDAGYMSIDGTSKKHKRGSWVEVELVITDDYYDQKLTLEDFKEDWNNRIITEEDKKLYYLSLVSRPTQSLLQKWLREKHRIYIEITIDTYKSPNTLATTISILNVQGTDVIKKFFSMEKVKQYSLDEYEEALEKGLQESLKLIK